MLNIFETGTAMLTGSSILEGRENSKETSRSVDLKFKLSPSDENKMEDSIGRVVLVGTTLFKVFKASNKTALLISKFIIKNINKRYYIKIKYIN